MKLIPEDLPNEYRLLVACARRVLTGQQLEQAEAAITAGLDWDLLSRLAREHGLSPLLYSHLQRHFPLAVASRQEHRLKLFETGVRNLSLSAALLNILEALRNAGIRALAYKGPTLAAALYGDIAWREISDLDILIDRPSFPAAREVLSGLGYQPSGNPPASGHSRKQEDARLRSDCECEFYSADGQVTVDLHWQITAPHLAQRFSFDDLWDRHRMVTLGQKSVPTFSAEDTALVLAVHGGKHLWDRLGWLADFAESVRKGLDWPALLLRARAARAERMLLLAFALAEDIMQIEIPCQFSSAIREDSVVQSVAATIAKRLFEDKHGKTNSDAEESSLRWLTLVQLADRRWDGIRSAGRFALGFGLREWQAVRLPDSLFPFYRLVRMATVLRSIPAFCFPGRRASRNSG